MEDTQKGVDASPNGYSYLEFTNGVSFQSQIPTSAPPYPEKAVCVIRGSAKYRDPKTGLPYATKEAFKIIREKYLNDGSGIKEKNSMGVLYELTSGEGGYLRLILSRNLLSTLEEMFHLVGVAVHGKWHNGTSMQLLATSW